jgi:hypothetical protein
MSWLTTLVELTVPEWVYRAVTGTPSPVWSAAQEAALKSDIARAGGSDAAANSAAQEVDSFLAKFWPARDPLSTLADVLGGNPRGTSERDYTWLAVGFVAVVVVLLAIGYSKSGKTTVVVRGARRSRSK